MTLLAACACSGEAPEYFDLSRATVPDEAEMVVVHRDYEDRSETLHVTPDGEVLQHQEFADGTVEKRIVVRGHGFSSGGGKCFADGGDRCHFPTVKNATYRVINQPVWESHSDAWQGLGDGIERSRGSWIDFNMQWNGDNSEYATVSYERSLSTDPALAETLLYVSCANAPTIAGVKICKIVGESQTTFFTPVIDASYEANCWRSPRRNFWRNITQHENGHVYGFEHSSMGVMRANGPACGNDTFTAAEKEAAELFDPNNTGNTVVVDLGELQYE